MPVDSLVVCVVGAECSGKTTLAEALAESCGAPLAPEAARGYMQRQGLAAAAYAKGDVLAIAREQMRLERNALAGEPPLLICDTDLLVIQVWWEVKYGALPRALSRALAKRSPRAYLLTRPDIPWAPDALRESGGERDGLHRRYRSLLAAGGHPYVELSGDPPTRLAAAKKSIARWLEGN